MDPLQTRALNALAPFVALSKAATSTRAACELITQATSHPETYVFAELLALPPIQSLRTSPSPGPSFYHLLEIFSWGTYADYKANSSLPTLTPQQTQKLRLLSLSTLLSTPTHQPPTYPPLLDALSLSSASELESLLREATYAGILTCTLSPRAGLIHVTSIAPLRDPAPGSIPTMLATLSAWDGRCVAVLDELEAEIESIRMKGRQRRRRDQLEREAVERIMDKGVNTATTTTTTTTATTTARTVDKGLGKRVAGSDLEGDGEFDGGTAADGGGSAEKTDRDGLEMDVDAGEGEAVVAGEKTGGGGGGKAGAMGPGRAVRKSTRTKAARGTASRGGKRAG